MARSLYLISYDVADNRRRYRIDRILKGYGERVQKSVFECYLDADTRGEMIARLHEVLTAPEDSLRCYPLCGKDRPELRCIGPAVETEDWTYLVV